MMTKKNFEAIAGIIFRQSLTDGQRVELANKLADEFEKTNDYFKRDRFLAACGVPEGVKLP